MRDESAGLCPCILEKLRKLKIFYFSGGRREKVEVEEERSNVERSPARAGSRPFGEIPPLRESGGVLE